MVDSEVDCEISEAVKNTISRRVRRESRSAFQRREPSEPKAVPMSMPASAMNTRARKEPDQPCVGRRRENQLP